MQAERKFNGEYKEIDYDATSKSSPPIETVVQNDRVTTDMASRGTPQQEITRVPNWVFPIMATVLMVLLGFVYTTMEREITDIKLNFQRELTDIKNEASTNTLLIRNMREQLIAHGWTIDETGALHPPPRR